MPLDTIYVIHHTHTDIGFTNDQARFGIGGAPVRLHLDQIPGDRATPTCDPAFGGLT